MRNFPGFKHKTIKSFSDYEVLLLLSQIPLQLTIDQMKST